MDLILTVLIFVLANIAFFYPLVPSQSRQLQGLLVVLLGVLVLVKGVQLLRLKTKAEEDLPLQSQDGPSPVAAAIPMDAAVEAGVVQFLARLQEKGRLVDFLMDDITPYSNEQIGVVARVVHQDGSAPRLAGDPHLAPPGVRVNPLPGGE